MLTNNAAGGLGHIQFGELDLGNVPPHIRDAPSPNLPPTVFPMNGYREHRGGEHPREQTLTNGPKENSRSQYMASKADVSSSACGRNELQTQVQVQGGHQSQSQSQRLVGPSSHAFKNTSKGNVQGGFQGSTGKVWEHCQGEDAAPKGSYSADQAPVQGHIIAGCPSCSSLRTKSIGHPSQKMERSHASHPSGFQMLEERISQEARRGNEPGNISTSAAAGPAESNSHQSAPSSPQSSQASTGYQTSEPMSSTGGPKVIPATPSASNSGGPGRKMTWAKIVSKPSKPPKRVPYTTQAAGTIPPVPCCAESIMGSHFLADHGSGVLGSPAPPSTRSNVNYQSSNQEFHPQEQCSNTRANGTAGDESTLTYGHCSSSMPNKSGQCAKRVPCTSSLQKNSTLSVSKSGVGQPARKSSTDSDRLKCFSSVRALSSDGTPVTNVEVIPGAIDHQTVQHFHDGKLSRDTQSATTVGHINDKQQQDDERRVQIQTAAKEMPSTSTSSWPQDRYGTSFPRNLPREDQQQPIFNSPVTSTPMANVLNMLCGTEPMEATRFYEQGIMNLGSTCFLGSALQLLLGSELFCGLLHQLDAVRSHLYKGKLPTLCALGDLASKLSRRRKVSQPGGKSGLDHSVGMGRSPYAIVPTMLSPVLEKFHKRFSGYQGGPEEQDAQEFLLFLLDQIESELQLVKLNFKGQEEEQLSYDSDSEGWLVAGKNNKGSVRRTAGSTASNIVTSLFGGIIESQVRVKDRQVKDKSPSVTSHRFTALDLDIANKKVQSVDDALQLYTAKDSISDYRVEGCNRPVTAEKANLLSNLPPVLLISLKRYAFTASGMEKIQKKISFGRKLSIPAKYLVSGEQSAQYELIATCSHHGRGHGGDHYTANVMQPGGYWVHFDDSTHRAIKDKEVANDTPYLMLYRKLNKKPLSYQ